MVIISPNSRKDQTNAIFLKRQELKDINYDKPEFCTVVRSLVLDGS